jgi:WXG100 family type VII secretion target
LTPVIGVAMGNLVVAPEEVFHAATAGRTHHEQLAGTYASTQSQAWDAESGWVGQSGAALSGLLDRWQSHAADHHRMLNDHHDGLCSAATAFGDMDDDNAQRVKLVTGRPPPA